MKEHDTFFFKNIFFIISFMSIFKFQTSDDCAKGDD